MLGHHPTRPAFICRSENLLSIDPMTWGTTPAAPERAARQPYPRIGSQTRCVRAQSQPKSQSGVRRLVASVIIGFVAIVAGFGLAIGGTVSSARAEGEASLFSLVKQARSDNGKTGLLRNEAMDQVALDWANRMAADGVKSHNPNLESQLPDGWTGGAENVANGQSDVQAVHTAWMESPGHRENILGDYTDIGLAFINANGTTWGVEVFASYPDHLGSSSATGTGNAASPSSPPQQDASAAGSTDKAAPAQVPGAAGAKTAKTDPAGKPGASAEPSASAKPEATAAATAAPHPGVHAQGAEVTPEPTPAGADKLAGASAREQDQAQKPIIFTLVSSTSTIGRFSGGPAQVAGMGFGGILVAAASAISVWPAARRWWLSDVLRRIGH